MLSVNHPAVDKVFYPDADYFALTEYSEDDSEPPFSPQTPPELLGPAFADRTAFLCFLFVVLEST